MVDMNADDETLLSVLQESLLPGQTGIKIRAFLAFNRDNPLVRIDNIEKLRYLGVIDINEDSIYPLETL